MELKTNYNKHYVNVSFSINLPFGWAWRASTTIYEKPNQYTYGYNNRCADGKYILFMDYDDLELFEISQEIEFLQEKYKLGNMILFKLDRLNSWHVVCLDKLSLYEVWEILHASSCDGAFTNAVKILNTRKWVLRIDSKGNRQPPKYHHTLIAKIVTKREQSKAHQDFLFKTFSVPKTIEGKWDKLGTIGIIRYNTANRTNK